MPIPTEGNAGTVLTQPSALVSQALNSIRRQPAGFVSLSSVFRASATVLRTISAWSSASGAASAGHEPWRWE
jgi:hypothetical protein